MYLGFSLYSSSVHQSAWIYFKTSFGTSPALEDVINSRLRCQKFWDNIEFSRQTLHKIGARIPYADVMLDSMVLRLTSLPVEALVFRQANITVSRNSFMISLRHLWCQSGLQTVPLRNACRIFAP
ncbi:hypothetical protein SCHPADRAFT_393926 [Schizopora paradoxa]|uniref:Uncharacterized protein n=1 Tax=Schizopora paradoxa TaxID=27342 RepID=A0A0H2RLT6_9AGAM|nr:hypothetical protein SCHPADRAFT_393926 [Schizopora paradoxa]